MTTQRSDWLICETPNPRAALRLVCFPHAGGSASFYRQWADSLPDAEVYAVQYPGRATMFHMPPAEDLCELATGIAQAIRCLTDRPLALFGHSLGAPVALETARELGRLGVEVAHLLVSGSRDAPLPVAEESYDDDPDRVLSQLVELGGTDAEMASDPVFREIVLPYLIADGRMFHNYNMAPGPLLGCPVTAVVGDIDDHADRRPWSRLSEGSFRQVRVPGDHFYLIEEPPYAVIREALSGKPTSTL